MASKVSIWNQAIMNCGSSNLIQDPDEASEEARLCTAVHDAAVKITLESFDWNFARKYQSLADIGSPPDNWAFRYQYPTDCVMARGFVEDPKVMPPNAFEVKATDDLTNRVILCNISPATLIYTGNVTDTARFSQAFADAMAWDIAYRIALPLTGDKEIRNQAQLGFRSSVALAAANTLNEGHSNDSYEAEWTRGRE